MGRGVAAGKARTMTDVEAAWMGAMVEGEGHYFLHPPDSKSRNVGLRIGVAVTNTDPEIMSACLRLTQTGKVDYKGFANSRIATARKPCYRWAIQAWTDTLNVLRQLRPYSMKAQAALNEIGAFYGAPV